jgi:hypothetical protein
MRLIVLVLLLIQGFVYAKDNAITLALDTPRSEVIEALGEPIGKASDGRDEILYYSDDREIRLRDGKVVMVSGSEGLIMKRAERQEKATVESSAIDGLPSVDISTLGLDEEMANDFMQFQSEEFDSLPTWMIGVGLGFFLVIIFFMMATSSAIFRKAGHAGLASLVPVYSAYVMMKIAGKPGWWLWLMLVPPVNVVIAIMVPFGVAEMFGKGWGFGLGLLFLPWIFYPILAFGSSEYQGGVA